MDSFFSEAVSRKRSPIVVNANGIVISVPAWSNANKWDNVRFIAPDTDVITVNNAQRAEFACIIDDLLHEIKHLGFMASINCTDTILFWGHLSDIASKMNTFYGLPLTIGTGKSFEDAKLSCVTLKSSKKAECKKQYLVLRQ